MRTLTKEEQELYRQARREQNRKYRIAHREQLNAYQKQYRQAHPEKVAIWEQNRIDSMINRQREKVSNEDNV